jgi:hypothetical protein
MRELVRKGQLSISEIGEDDFKILLSEAIHNSDVGLVNNLIEERAVWAFNFEDDTNMTSKLLLI